MAQGNRSPRSLATLAVDELHDWLGEATFGSVRGGLSILGPLSDRDAHRAVMAAVMLGWIEMTSSPGGEPELRLPEAAPIVTAEAA